jgi:VWFA-related protein
MKRATGAAGIACAALAAGAAVAQAPDPPVFRSSVDAVYVDVFVTDGASPVPGLRALDFELKDNGVRQEVGLAALESLPLTALLVFDTSSSLTPERLRALRAAGEAFLDGLRPADRAGLLAFSEEIALVAEPTSDTQAVRGALARLRATGSTAVYDALFAALVLADEGPRSVIVLFTDGEDNQSVLDETQLRRAAERSNAVIHVVGWTSPSGRQHGPMNWTTAPGIEGRPTPSAEAASWVSEVRQRALRGIAEAAGGAFWTAESPARLRDAFAAIAAAMAQRYVLQYEPRGVPQEGWHDLDVRLRGAKGRVQARRGYWGRSR